MIHEFWVMFQSGSETCVHDRFPADKARDAGRSLRWLRQSRKDLKSWVQCVTIDPDATAIDFPPNDEQDVYNRPTDWLDDPDAHVGFAKETESRTP